MLSYRCSQPGTAACRCCQPSSMACRRFSICQLRNLTGAERPLVAASRSSWARSRRERRGSTASQSTRFAASSAACGCRAGGERKAAGLASACAYLLGRNGRRAASSRPTSSSAPTTQPHLPAVHFVQHQHRIRHKLVSGAVRGVEVEVGACRRGMVRRGTHAQRAGVW